jgi:predicted dehydrogenase
MAALAAGKAVYCEAPLGRDAAEGEAMAAAARAAGVATAVGLQGRLHPAARRAAALVADGALGRVLAARVLSTSAAFGPAAPAAYAYFDEAASGANLLTITGGHTLDLVEAVLGPLAEVEARTATLFPAVHLLDTGATSRREVPDNLLLIGRTAGGAEVVVDVEGGRAMDRPEFRLVVRGTAGTLALTGGATFGFQGGDLRLEASVPFEAPEAQAAPGASGPAINVAELYALLARDLREGTRTAPGFDHGARVSRLMEAVARAGVEGRQRVPGAG